MTATVGRPDCDVVMPPIQRDAGVQFVAMRRRAVSLIALCSVVGLAACGSSTSKSATTLAPISRNTVFTTLPTTTPLTTAPPVVTAPGGAPVTTIPGAAADGSTTYTVKAGDILVRIAKTYNCSYQDILTANSYTGDASAFLPAVGATFTLPANCKLTAAQTTPTAAPTATTKAGTKTTTTVKGATTTTVKGGATTVPGSVAAGQTYTVVANDTLSGIGKKFGTTAQAIVAANGWSDGVTHHINPGDVIKLPAKKA